MNAAAHTSSAPQGSATLREYSLRVIRFLADAALDPHRYFEQKYCGAVTAADNDAEIIRILVSLVDWANLNGLTANGLEAFDRSLRTDRMPAFSMFRDSATRSAAIVLARGPLTSAEDSRIVREFLRTAAPDDPDRRLAESRLGDYEQR